jgi:phage repressor protein C with HTH and peptisase S24 domain
MDRIADVIGCEPSDLITEKVTESPLLGYIGAGGMYYPDPESGPWIASGFVPAPPDGSDCSALIVKGSSMEPVYHNGDILYYEVKDLNDKNRWANHDCIVQIEGGEAYLRTVELDPKTSKFNLTMYNKEPMLRARIEWAAPILWVRKWNGSKPNK